MADDVHALASSVGSDVFFALSFLAICLLVLLLIRYYLPLRHTPAYLLLPVFLALALPSSIVLLVPIDLASSQGIDPNGPRGIWLPERLLLVCWRIAYWLTFCLTWVILPLLGEYSDSGHRDNRGKLLYSLRSNAQYQLIVLGCGIAGAVYFFLNVGFNFVSLRALVMALAYAWGLVLAIYLMGHGLVAIPKRLIRDASISARLRRTQTHAPKVYEKRQDAIDELADMEEQVLVLRQRKTGTAREFHEWIEELADKSGEPESSLPRGGGGATTPNVITERYMADLTRKLKRARHKRARFEDEWQRLVKSAEKDQAILDSATTKTLKFSDLTAGETSRFTMLTPSTRFYFYTYILPALSMALGAFLAVVSVGVIYSEVIKATKLQRYSLVNLTVIHYRSEGKGALNFGNQLVAAAWLCYMCAAALYSITEVKVWGNRALVRRQTYPESACWYASQVAKLTVPLSYNFAEMTDPDVFKGTVFYNFLGKLIKLTPLGSGFTGFFPLFILVPVLFNLFNLYGKIKRFTDFGDLVLDEDEEQSTGTALAGSGSWREGQALIERELNRSRGGERSAALGLLSRSASPSTTTSGRGSFERTRPTTSAARRTLGDVDDGTSRVDQRLANATQAAAAAEEEEGGFFQDFMHRVKNTFDTTDRPQWLDRVTPRWMEGTGDNGRGTEGLGRFFGGRAREGTVRL